MSRTISQELAILANTKSAIRAAIEAKGVAVSDSDSFASYATKIQSIQTGGRDSVLDPIQFADPEVKRICVDNWGSNGEISYLQAARVTSLLSKFRNNSTIEHFDEFQYFIGIENLEGLAFYYDTALQSITLPNGLLTIGNAAFQGCSALESITIPASVTEINNSFPHCNYLREVFCKPTTPPTIGSVTFAGTHYNGLTIYVPDESVDAYKTATNWAVYADNIIGESEQNGVTPP